MRISHRFGIVIVPLPLTNFHHMTVICARVRCMRLCPETVGSKNTRVVTP